MTLQGLLFLLAAGMMGLTVAAALGGDPTVPAVSRAAILEARP